MTAVDRARVLAFRVVAHGLDRPGGRPAVLDLGVQDTPAGSAALALAARGAGVETDGSVVPAWTMRGAPHLHPAATLPGLARALWPLSEVDALSRLAWQRSRVREAGMDALDALTVVARTMRSVVTGVMSKGEASAAVTAEAPESLSAWCRPCNARHVFEQLFRLSALPAGLRLEPGLAPAHLVPMPDRPDLPVRPSGVDERVRAYLRFLGPAGPAEVAGFLGGTRAQLRTVWPDDLVEIEVDGTRAWIAEPDLAALDGAPRPELVRLLPPSDPYLQARDRELLLPAKASRKALWPVIGPPGAVLVDGELAGTWRARMSGRNLRITVAPFGSLPSARRAALTAEAEVVAAVRGAATVDLVVE